MRIITVLILALSVSSGACASIAQQPEAKTEALTSDITGTLVGNVDGKTVPDIWLILLAYEGKDAKGEPKVRPIIVAGGMPKAKTSASGTFTFTEIPAGVYVIKAGSDQYSFTGGYIYIKKDSGPELGVIDLSPAVKVNIGKITVERN